MTRSWRLPLLLLISCLALTCQAANILDLLEWSLTGKGPEVRAEGDDGPSQGGQRNCMCDRRSCICCAEFNFTFVDLGGPGCVRLKYLSQDEGFAVNVSYGNSILRSQVLKGPNPEPTCINLLSRVAQLCARLTELAPTSDGLRGCLQLEPTLLGESQLDFPLGCFRSGPDGMAMEAVKYNKTSEASTNETSGTDSINTAQIIQAVNESAEEGIAFFSNLLGLAFGNSTDAEEEDEDEVSSSPKPEVTTLPSPPQSNARKSKKLLSPGANMI